MGDETDLKKSVIYQLSKMPGLNWFKHVILVSSYQDSYAPFDSARIQINNRASANDEKGNIYTEMAQNILKNLPQDVLYRIDIDFSITDNNLDSFIGRTAHIQFLEC